MNMRDALLEVIGALILIIALASLLHA